MLIDDTPIIIATGNHAPLVHTIDQYLAAGYHKLEIDYVNYNSLAVIGDFGIKKQTDGTYAPPACSISRPSTLDPDGRDNIL